MITMNKNSNLTITKQRIAAPKLLILLSAILSLVLDAAVIAVLFGNTTELKFWICPVLLAALDALFVVKVIFSNFRFSYAINGTLIHIGCVLVISAYALLSTGVLYESIVFAGFMLYLMPAVHLLQSVAVILNAVHSSNNTLIVRKVFALALSLVFAVGAGYYVSELLTVGFFGQGTERTERTAVYELNDDGDGYVVIGVLEGKGNTLTVPESFNDMPVTGISCGVFTNTELAYVVFEAGADIAFLDVNELVAANPELRIETPKTEIDSFRRSLYALALENAAMLPLANGIAPADLSENEIYVTFSYDMNTLATVKGEIIPTWFGGRGDNLDIRRHAASVKYVEYSEINNSVHMCWCYDNQDKLVFSGAMLDDTAASMSAKSLKESRQALVTFDKIYSLKVNPDNDDVYEIADEYKSISAEREYKLVTKSSLTGVLAEIPSRDGFALSWRYAGQLFTTPEQIMDRLIGLEAVNASLSEITLDPIWEIADLENLAVTANNEQGSHSALYGTDVMVMATADAPIPELALSYKWSFGGAELDANSFNWYMIDNIYPSDAGTYTVDITVSDPEKRITSLEKHVSATVDVKFVKKQIQVLWDMPTADELVYSATDKREGIVTTFDVSAIVNAQDEAELTAALAKTYVTQHNNTVTNTVKNVGTYEVTAMLQRTGDDPDTAASEKYELMNVKQTFEVTPYTLNVSWGEREFVYNGAEQAPGAAVTPLLNDNVTVSVTRQKNAGEYTATATITNANYTLENSTCDYRITKRSITSISWTDNSSFVYNGNEQKPTVTYFENVISGEESTVRSDAVYSGAGRNAGYHTVSVSLRDSSNYVITCANTRSYTIEKADLEVNLSATSRTYDGRALSGFTYTLVGKAGADNANEIFEITYTGSAVGAVNADDYVLSASLTEKEKYSNYNVTVNDVSVSIYQRSINVNVNNLSKTYDGRTFGADEFGYTISGSGLASTDTASEVFSIVYSNDALSAINAQSTVITAEITEMTKGANYVISVNSGTLVISKRDLSIRADNASKTYDGKAYNTNLFTYTVTGLADVDNIDDVVSISISGNAIGAKNAGTSYTIGLSTSAGAKYSNYNVRTSNGTLRIDKAPLTLTLSAQNRVYDGTTGGNFSYSVDGLVGGESESVLGNIYYSGTAVTAKNAGTYALSASFSGGSGLANYNVQCESAELVISPKAITVTAVATDRDYVKGMVGGTFDFTVTGLVDGDTKRSLGTATYGGSAVTATEAGTYELTVTISGGVSGNYAITYVSDTAFVIKAVANNATPKSKE